MKKLKPYLFLILFFIVVFALPKVAVQKVRHLATSMGPSNWKDSVIDLETENSQLRQGIDKLRSWMTLEQSVERDFHEARRLFQLGSDPFYERRGRYLAQLIDLQLRGVPAQVILRQPSSWNSQVWLNVGSDVNQQVGVEIVDVGSPVVVGKNVVGIVEEVLSKRCRVRLITDPSLNISVRCVRGEVQEAHLAEQCRHLADLLNMRGELDGAAPLSRALSAFSSQIQAPSTTHYLAKGILHGTGESFIGKSGKLIGEGFQYDFPDEEGSSCDLRTGKSNGISAAPLIAVGDLLLTTGFDGLFPQDLQVGIVTKIHLLPEGGCCFELEAKALAPHLNEIKSVTVLPTL